MPVSGVDAPVVGDFRLTMLEFADTDPLTPISDIDGTAIGSNTETAYWSLRVEILDTGNIKIGLSEN